MDVLDFTPDLTGEWSAFVASHPLSSHGHLAAQFAFARASGIRDVSLAVRDGGRLAGVLPLWLVEHRALRGVRVREVASGAFFPAAPLVSPALKGKAEARVMDLLLGAARSRAEALKADRLVVTHPHVAGGQPSIVRLAYSPLLHHGYRPRHGVGLLLDLSRTGAQLASGRRSGCRQSITKAEGAASVQTLTDRSEWQACRELNLQTLGDLAFSDRQLASIWDDFIVPGHATAHAAYVDGAIAAVTVTIHTNGSAYYWIGLNRRPAPLPGAGHLALWTAILEAQARGCTHFELGSLDFDNPRNIGISQFKQSFGGVPYQIISAQLELKPVKAAAIALGEAVLASARHWRALRRADVAAHPSQKGAPAAPTAATPEAPARAPAAANAGS